MEARVVIERVQRIAGVRVDVVADRASKESALVDVRRVRAWLDSSEAYLASSLAAEVSFPEQAIAETSKESLGSASKTLDRSKTLDEVPALAGALDEGEITAGHVDAVTRAGKRLNDEQRAVLHERVDSLSDVAAHATQAEFGKRVRDEARRIVADDGMDRLERQQRATSLRSWVDDEGMWNLRGRFDPVTGVRIAARVDTEVAALFAEATPGTCPSDPVERQHHLRALALDRLVSGGGSGVRSGRPEFVVVIDVEAADVGASEVSGPEVAWSIPVEVPWRVLAELSGEAGVHGVVVRNGVVVHAPGELNLGRTTRLANRAQRRALRGLYTTCAVPGCSTHYDRCKLHHVIWWRHGGRTDLDNLLPLCSRHHHKVHEGGWQLTIGPNRELGISFPDGTIHNTGPPSRGAA